MNIIHNPLKFNARCTNGSLLFYLVFLLSNIASGQVNVLMHHNNVSRTGVNYEETQLTTANVNVENFGKVFSIDVDDQIYAQPLIFSNIPIRNKGVHNIVIIATVNNSLYAFDTDNLSNNPLWQCNFNGAGIPVRNTNMPECNHGPYKDFSGNIGIVGTPAIDQFTKTLYVVARTKEPTENDSIYVQRLHAIDLSDGSEKPGSPVIIHAAITGTVGNDNNAIIDFDPFVQNQRAALTLVNGVVYIAWAAHCDGGLYHGWILGYDANTLQQVVAYNDTRKGDSAGIWMAGAGFGSDEDGNLYLTTGNGSVGYNGDPTDENNRGESALKLTRSGNTLIVSSWFTPYNYNDLEINDRDLGSSGPVLIPGTTLMAFGGKGGVMYVVDRDHMGGLHDNDSQIAQRFPVLENQHIHGTPVFYGGSNGQFLYVWSENDYLKAYKFDGATQRFQLPEYAKSNVIANDGMPGGMLSVSSNGQMPGTGILWASHPEHDALNHVTGGILRAFDAADITKELWNSTMNSTRDGVGNFAKFNCPTIANGKVYLATFSNKLNVYGVSPVGPPPPPTDENVALHAFTAASGSCNNFETSNFAVDGSIGTKWCDNTSIDKWLFIDLGKYYDIHKWVVKHAQEGGEPAFWNTRDFVLQRSFDAVNWENIDWVTGNIDKVTNRDVAPFTSRFIGLYVANPGGDEAARIYEVELYGKESAFQGISNARYNTDAIHINHGEKVSNVEITLYPNPSTGTVNISLPSAMKGMVDISITNMLNVIVSKESRIVSNGEPLTIDTNRVARGTYFVTVQHAGKRTILKMIVMN